MAFLAFLVLMSLLAAVVSFPGWVARRSAADARPAGHVPPAMSAHPAAAGLPRRESTLAARIRALRDTDSELAEAVLATRLLSGELSADRYRDEIALLAVRDAARHPMVVPPDGAA